MFHIMKYASVGKTKVEKSGVMRRFLSLNPWVKSVANRLYRRRVASRHTGLQERERHLRQMAAGQLDFSASNPLLWRHRPLTPVYVTDTRSVREFGRLMRRRFNRNLKRQGDGHVH